MGLNQINYHKIDEESKRELELEFKTKHQFLMCPFVLVDGVDDITQGIYANDSERFKSRSLERVFEGRNPVIALWKNSTKTKMQYTEGGIPDYDKLPYKEFSVGDYFPVIIEPNGETYYSSFRDDVNGNKRWSTDSTIVVKLNQELTRDEWYDFYLFPELGEELYFVQSISISRDASGKFAVTELTLKKVNDELENVTTNSSTLLLLSSPGEEYAWPKVVYLDELETSSRENGDEDGNTNTALWNELVLDESKLIPSGVRYLQLSSLEPMLLGSFYAWGRPIGDEDRDGNRYLEEPRHLLPADCVPAVADPIVGINAPSDKFLWIEKGSMKIGKEYADWMSSIKEKVTGLLGWGETNNQIKNYGAIKVDDIKTAIESAPDKTKQDSSGGDITVSQTYWDDWIIAAQATIETDDSPGYKTYSPYSGDRILNGTAPLAQKLSRNIFIYSNVVTLPVEYEAKVPFSFVNMVVGFFRKLILGKDGQYLSDNSTNRDAHLDLPLVAEHSYLNLIYTGLMDGGAGEADTKTYLPLQLFSGDRPEILTGKNINTFNIKISLTDKILKDDGTTITTNQLGVDGLNYFDHTMVPQETDTAYMLDRVIVQGVAMGDIKITAFNSQNQSVGSFICNTNSKRTGSILDWTTVIKLSEWETDETLDLTPDIPDATNKGLNDTYIDDIVFTGEIKSSNSDSTKYDIDLTTEANTNLYELWKEQNEEADETFDEFMRYHTITFDVDIELKVDIDSKSAVGGGSHLVNYHDPPPYGNQEPNTSGNAYNVSTHSWDGIMYPSSYQQESTVFENYNFKTTNTLDAMDESLTEWDHNLDPWKIDLAESVVRLICPFNGYMDGRESNWLRRDVFDHDDSDMRVRAEGYVSRVEQAYNVYESGGSTLRSKLKGLFGVNLVHRTGTPYVTEDGNLEFNPTKITWSRGGTYSNNTSMDNLTSNTSQILTPIIGDWSVTHGGVLTLSNEIYIGRWKNVSLNGIHWNDSMFEKSFLQRQYVDGTYIFNYDAQHYLSEQSGGQDKHYSEIWSDGPNYVGWDSVELTYTLKNINIKKMAS